MFCKKLNFSFQLISDFFKNFSKFRAEIHCPILQDDYQLIIAAQESIHVLEYL
jgi:hypothetical protein